MAYLSTYDFEYKLLPSWVSYFNKKTFLNSNGIHTLTNDVALSHYLVELGFTTSELNLKNINIFKFRADNTVNCILYEFPAPLRPPFAKYALIVFSKSGETEIARYFTLEKSHSFRFGFNNQGDSSKKETANVSSSWVLGEMSDSGHFNYGTINYEASAENFIHDILSRFYDNTHYKHSKSAFPEINYKPTIFLYVLSFIFPLVAGICTFAGLLNFALLVFGSMICLGIWLYLFAYDVSRISDVIFVNFKSVALKWGTITMLGYILGALIGIII